MPFRQGPDFDAIPKNRSWWGRQDPTDKAIRLMMDRAPAHGLTVCVYWERLSPQPDKLAASADLSYLLHAFGDKPGYLRVSNRPVVILYSGVCQSLSSLDWEEVLALNLKRFAGGFVAIGIGDRLSDALLWDGLHTLDVATPSPLQRKEAGVRSQASMNNIMARKLGHISVETVLPGYDDRKSNATSALPGGRVIQREDGALYRALWSQEVADDPDWVLVSSFNKWHNGTEIEPSVEMGDRYLQITAEFAGRFKSGLGK